MKIHTLVWLLPCLLMAVPANAATVTDADEISAIKTQIKLLMQKVEALEARSKPASTLVHSEPAATTVVVTEKTLTQPAAQPAGVVTNAAVTAENTGNPSISVIGTFAGSAMRGGNAVRQTAFLPMSEGEFVFGADVDAHTRLDITVTAANGAMAAEEAYLTTHLPEGFNLRAGRKFIPLGRANEVHPHALVYADMPNGLVNLFGPDKFIGEGVFIDHPLFIGDSAHALTIGFFQNANAVAFDPTGVNQFAGMGRWTGLWDLSDTTTMELGSTLISGRNGIAGASRTDILGGHLALKHKAFDHSGWSLEGEWNRSRINNGIAVARLTTDGAYLLGEYDFNRNWLGFARYDFSRITGSSAESAYTAGLGWKISEFQSLTLQYKHTRNALAQTAGNLGIATGQRANEALFRWVVAIGPHHAHSY